MKRISAPLLVTCALALTGCGKGGSQADDELDCKAIADHVTSLLASSTGKLDGDRKQATTAYLPALRSQIVASCTDDAEGWRGDVARCVMAAEDLTALGACKADLAVPPSPKPAP